jgi:hypothetical protein
MVLPLPDPVGTGWAAYPLAAVVNLNGPGAYVHWGVIQLSVANLVVIAIMVVVFVLTLVLPFPGRRRNR